MNKFEVGRITELGLQSCYTRDKPPSWYNDDHNLPPHDYNLPEDMVPRTPKLPPFYRKSMDVYLKDIINRLNNIEDQLRCLKGI